MNEHTQPSDGAETWCRDCDQPAVETVETTQGRQYLCHKHAANLAYKLYCNGFKVRESEV